MGFSTIYKSNRLVYCDGWTPVIFDYRESMYEDIEKWFGKYDGYNFLTENSYITHNVTIYKDHNGDDISLYHIEVIIEDKDVALQFKMRWG